MPILNIPQLLSPVSEKNPCGEFIEDFEYSEPWQALQQKIQPEQPGQPEKNHETDWRAIEAESLSLFQGCKSLRLTNVLTQALLHRHELTGLNEALALIHQLLLTWWSSLEPVLDTDADPTLRINLLNNLASQAMCQSLRQCQLIHSPRLGRFALRDVLIALGKLKPVKETENQADLPMVQAALQDCDQQKLRQAHNEIKGCVFYLDEISKQVAQQAGPQYSPEFSNLKQILQPVLTFLNESLREEEKSETEPEASTMPDQTPSPSPSPSPSPCPVHSQTANISSREDVLASLEQICEYYRRFEPSSPVPVFLQGAKKFLNMDFLSVIKELTPEGIKQLENIGGNNV